LVLRKIIFVGICEMNCTHVHSHAPLLECLRPTTPHTHDPAPSDSPRYVGLGEVKLVQVSITKQIGANKKSLWCRTEQPPNDNNRLIWRIHGHVRHGTACSHSHSLLCQTFLIIVPPRKNLSLGNQIKTWGGEGDRRAGQIGLNNELPHSFQGNSRAVGYVVWKPILEEVINIKSNSPLRIW